jgi:hypothetical protein
MLAHRVVRLFLVTAGIWTLPNSGHAQVVLDLSGTGLDDPTSSTAMLLSNARLRAGLEHVNTSVNTLSAAVAVSLGPVAPALYATARGDLEAKVVLRPKAGLGIITGFGRIAGRADKAHEPVAYLAPEWVIGGEFQNDGMFALGLEAVRVGDEDRVGWLGAANISGWFAGVSRVWEGWRLVSGYVARDAPAARFFMIDRPGFRRTEVLATVHARGLGNFDAMQALRGRRHNLSESTALGVTNPLRFAGGDVDGRGRDLVLGITHVETASSESVDVEVDKYVHTSSWFGIGYRFEDRDASNATYLKLLAGHTPDFRYALASGDTKIRLELLMALDGGGNRALLRFIQLF